MRQKQVRCQRTGYENTTTGAKPENNNKKQNIEKINPEMTQDTKDARRSERLPLRRRKAYVLRKDR